MSREKDGRRTVRLMIFLAALVMAHWGALWLMDRLEVAQQLLSPAGAESVLALLGALAFIALRLTVIWLVPGLVLWAVVSWVWSRLGSGSATGNTPGQSPSSHRRQRDRWRAPGRR
jgi:hypothetical protein